MTYNPKYCWADPDPPDPDAVVSTWALMLSPGIYPPHCPRPGETALGLCDTHHKAIVPRP